MHLRSRILSCLVLTATLAVPASAARADGLPSKSDWLADVHTAMQGSQPALGARIDEVGGSAVGKKLAVNLDIDNTSLASHYDPGKPVPDVLAFARYARSRGVLLLFNTGRPAAGGGQLEAQQQLVAAGFRVTEVCARQDGEGLVASKQRCRQHFADQGYTLIANVGNNRTDFTGSGYERAWRLPNYAGRLA